MISFLALGARCSNCRTPISWRYFVVELLTALTFVSMELRFGASVQTVAYCLFAAALIASLFIDLELFIIPDELNTFALAVGIAFDLWARSAHVPGHDLVGGWLPRSVLGAVVCAGVFVGIQVLGAALFRKDAMGDGDVKLGRAIGAMLPLSVALVSFLFAVGAGAVLGGLAMVVRSVRDGRPEPAAGADDAGEMDALPGTPMREVLLHGVMYMAFCDLAIALAARCGVAPAKRFVARYSEPVEEIDDFVPGPTHIPFGPYMVVGAAAAIFAGERFIAWYLAWAHLA